MAQEENIGDILRRRLAQRGLLKIYNSTRMVAAARGISKGEFEPISFRNGVLKIKTSSPAKAHKLKLTEKILIDEIESATNQRISRIIFTL